MYTTVVVILSLSCILFGDVQASRTGAVGSVACPDAKMDPSAGHGASPQTSDSPYNVQTSETSYVPGGKLTVTLRGTQSFKGFMVLALPASDDSAAPLGSFEDTGVLSQAVCIRGSTHTTSFSDAPADTIDLTWNAPSTDVGDVIFYATFVKQQSEYWVKVPSAVVSAPSTPEPPVAITTTTTASPTADSTSPTADSTSPSADSSNKASTDKPQGGESGDATKEGDDTNKGDDNSKGKGKRNSGTRHHGVLIALRDVISWLFCLIWY